MMEQRAELAELHGAHARIASLERLLQGTPQPPAERMLPVVLRWCALVAAIVLIAGALAAGATPRPEVVIRAAPAPPPAPVPAGDLEFFSLRLIWDANGPSLVDAEGKGSAHDLVVLAWRRGHADRPLHVVALRRGSYEVLWRSEGLPSRRSDPSISLAASGDKIAVSDAKHDVHILDVRSGRELRAVHGPENFEQLATLASDRGAVFTVSPMGLRRDETNYRIDLETGDITVTPRSERSFRYECLTDRSRACRSESLPAAKASMGKLVSPHVAEFAEDLVDDGDRISVVDDAARPQLVDFQLFAWNADGRSLWRAHATPPPRRALQGAGSGSHEWLALGNHRLVAIYLVGPAGHRVSAHDAATGKLAYDVALPELPYGLEVERLTLDGDTGFITATGAVFVLDAATGKITSTLRRF
jgi:hypothetical protein